MSRGQSRTQSRDLKQDRLQQRAQSHTQERRLDLDTLDGTTSPEYEAGQETDYDRPDDEYGQGDFEADECEATWETDLTFEGGSQREQETGQSRRLLTLEDVIGQGNPTAFVRVVWEDPALRVEAIAMPRSEAGRRAVTLLRDFVQQVFEHAHGNLTPDEWKVLVGEPEADWPRRLLLLARIRRSSVIFDKSSGAEEDLTRDGAARFAKFAILPDGMAFSIHLIVGEPAAVKEGDADADCDRVDYEDLPSLLKAEAFQSVLLDLESGKLESRSSRADLFHAILQHLETHGVKIVSPDKSEWANELGRFYDDYCKRNAPDLARRYNERRQRHAKGKRPMRSAKRLHVPEEEKGPSD